MRYILVFLLASSIIMAKSKESCYSVQLSSFVIKKDSSYSFNDGRYPESCKLISFTNMNAIRCGCFEQYNDAKIQYTILSPLFEDSKIVTTYKYRFAPKQSTTHTKNEKYPKGLITEKQLSIITTPKEAIKHSRLKKASVAKKELTTKTIDAMIDAEVEIGTELSNAILNSEETTKEKNNILKNISIQGNVDFTSHAYLSKPSDKHSNNFTASAELEMAYNIGDFQAFTKLKAQQDYYDIKGNSDSTDRSFLRLDELYAKYDFEDDQIMFGKNIRFWGALEVRNITDNFNIYELRADPFEKEKLGSWNASYTHYTDSGELSLIVKFYEQDRKMSAYPYVYYFFPQTVSPISGTELPLNYDKNLNTEKSQTHPSVYLKYAASTDTKYPLDFAVILENGYDSQRYYTQALSSDSSYLNTNENAYMVNKILTYNTLVYGPTLFKLEAVYADVIDNELISDYYHFGLGVEHTLTQLYKEADLGLIAEYYRYEILEKDKRDDLELFELFQNDIFLGFRYSFNEGNDASIVSGVILDLDYDEQVYYLEYEGRVADMFKINFDYRYTAPSSDYKTGFNLMGKHQRISLQMGYYF